MKLIHISDLHIGKRICEISMLDEQRHILDEILSVCGAEAADALLIAGDVYDKSVPPEEAVALFDSFLSALAEKKIPTFIISGNHDSSERVAFGSRIMDRSGIHISPVYAGKTEPLQLEDSFGQVFVYLLPYIRPSEVREFFPDREIRTYDDAVRAAVENMHADFTKRNIILSHQFVTGAEKSDSEAVMVGGLDNIAADIFAGFDYAALGHIHKPQSIGGNARYCGTPLKYSFSEAGQVKSLTVAELGKKGDFSLRTIPLTPVHDMRVIKGKYADIMSSGAYTEENRLDYVKIVLTDEEIIPDVNEKLKIVYENAMQITYERFSGGTADIDMTGAEQKILLSPLELLGDFYSSVNGKPLSDDAVGYLREVIEEIERGNGE